MHIVVTIETTCRVIEHRCNFLEKCEDSWKCECIFLFMLCLCVSGLPYFVFLAKFRQMRHVGLMELGTDRPALFQQQQLWKNWIRTLLTSPLSVRFQLPWLVAKDYFILTHVQSDLTYGAKPQPDEPNVSEYKLISLAVCYFVGKCSHIQLYGTILTKSNFSSFIAFETLCAPSFQLTVSAAVPCLLEN